MAAVEYFKSSDEDLEAMQKEIDSGSAKDVLSKDAPQDGGTDYEKSVAASKEAERRADASERAATATATAEPNATDAGDTIMRDAAGNVTGTRSADGTITPNADNAAAKSLIRDADRNLRWENGKLACARTTPNSDGAAKQQAQMDQATEKLLAKIIPNHKPNIEDGKRVYTPEEMNALANYAMQHNAKVAGSQEAAQGAANAAAKPSGPTALVDDAGDPHARFMERRKNFIESNPNAVSPGEREAVAKYFASRQPQGGGSNGPWDDIRERNNIRDNETRLGATRMQIDWQREQALYDQLGKATSEAERQQIKREILAQRGAGAVGVASGGAAGGMQAAIDTETRARDEKTKAKQGRQVALGNSIAGLMAGLRREGPVADDDPNLKPVMDADGKTVVGREMRIPLSQEGLRILNDQWRQSGGKSKITKMYAFAEVDSNGNMKPPRVAMMLSPDGQPGNGGNNALKVFDISEMETKLRDAYRSQGYNDAEADDAVYKAMGGFGTIGKAKADEREMLRQKAAGAAVRKGAAEGAQKFDDSNYTRINERIGELSDEFKNLDPKADGYQEKANAIMAELQVALDAKRRLLYGGYGPDTPKAGAGKAKAGAGQGNTDSDVADALGGEKGDGGTTKPEGNPNPVKTDNFDTELTPDEETRFQEWKKKYAPNDSGEDYDLRGAFKEGLVPGEDGHWSDKYKKPNHPTFSTESIYAKGKYADLAGTWDNDGNYVPSERRLQEDEKKTFKEFTDAGGYKSGDLYYVSGMEYLPEKERKTNSFEDLSEALELQKKAKAAKDAYEADLDKKIKPIELEARKKFPGSAEKRRRYIKSKMEKLDKLRPKAAPYKSSNGSGGKIPSVGIPGLTP